MTVLVVSNAGAARARRRVDALRQALPEPAASHRITEHPQALLALVGHDRWRRDDLLVINGGDGSVQHALTALLGRCPPARWPAVACLPGGTTNMTAYDLNAHRDFGRCLGTLKRACAPGDPVPPAPRRVVRVSGVKETAPGGEAPDQYGLFFGVGTIVQGIEYFHARIRRRGGHELGAGAALVRTLWGIARHQEPFSEPLRVRMTPPALTGPDGGEGAAAELSVRLLLATTLDRLFLGIRPYWGSGTGALKATMVERRARGFLSRMPRLLRGRPDETMTPALGYHSGRVDRLSLTFHGPCTLDGELFGNTDDPIDVCATEPVRFLRL